MNELTAQQRYSLALRQIADWYEVHPDAPMPSGGYQNLSIYDFDATPEQIRAIGAAKKEYSGSLFYYVVESENFTIKFIANRADVCTQKVVGFREIPEQFVEAHVIPAKREEIVEWECRESLLAAEPAAVQEVVDDMPF
jgi:hypothetical protein